MVTGPPPACLGVDGLLLTVQAEDLRRRGAQPLARRLAGQDQGGSGVFDERRELEELLGRKVDVVRYRERMSSFLKRRIDRDAVLSRSANGTASPDVKKINGEYRILPTRGTRGQPFGLVTGPAPARICVFVSMTSSPGRLETAPLPDRTRPFQTSL